MILQWFVEKQINAIEWSGPFVLRSFDVTGFALVCVWLTDCLLKIDNFNCPNNGHAQSVNDFCTFHCTFIVRATGEQLKISQRILAVDTVEVICWKKKLFSILIMEVNKDEAERCIDIAIEALKTGNVTRAEKFLNKAENLFPSHKAKGE